MQGRSTNFLISDADSGADDVRQRAEQFADPADRVWFYERVMNEIATLRAIEDGKCDHA